MAYGVVNGSEQKVNYSRFGLLKTASVSDWYPGGNLMHSNIFNCCGLMSMANFGTYKFSDYADKAEYVAAMFQSYRGWGHLLYAITEQQVKTSEEHALFLTMGAERCCAFPNLCHGPHTIELWVVNLYDGVGRYYDNRGTAFKKPPATEPSDIQAVIQKRAYVAKPAIRVSHPEQIGK